MTDDSNIRTIEISGHKFEVDLRTAKKIESYKVGDKVKVLIKAAYGSTYATHPGFIVGIDAFNKLPTIVVAYVPTVFGTEGKIEFAYLNAEAKDIEICPMSEDDVLPNAETIRTMFDRAIEKKQAELNEIVAKKEYFLRRYGVAFPAAITA